MTDIGPGNDDPAPQPGVVEPTADTPDPYGQADQASYVGDSADGSTGVDVPIDYLPPWSPTRAPGTQAPIVAGSIVPIDPWRPVIALLNADQLALLNRESAARQAAGMIPDCDGDT